MIKLPKWIRKKDIGNSADVVNDRLSDWLEKSRNCFNRMWLRVIDWGYYPKSYFILYESQGRLTLYHFENNLLIRVQEIFLDDTDSHRHIFQNPGLPIYLILQGQDCEFRTLATRQINFWDRFFLFNQLKDNEFNKNDLIKSYRPKHFIEKIDVFVAVRSSDFLKKIYDFLDYFKNPVSGIFLWDIEQSIAMKKQASVDHALHQWVVALVHLSGSRFTMIVLHEEALLLQRVIYSKNTKDIEKEIKSTLRFLQRQGYKEEQKVSILVPEGLIEIGDFSSEKFDAVTISRHLFEKESYKPVNGFLNFVPKILKQARIAYVLPRLAVKILIPLNAIILILWAILQIKSFFQDYELKWVHNSLEELSKNKGDNFIEQEKLSKLFKNYVATANHNPSELVANVNKILRGKLQATSISWSQGAKFNEMRLNFGNIQKDKTQDFKKSVNLDIEKLMTDKVINWEDNENGSTLIMQQSQVKDSGEQK